MIHVILTTVDNFSGHSAVPKENDKIFLNAFTNLTNVTARPYVLACLSGVFCCFQISDHWRKGQNFGSWNIALHNVLHFDQSAKKRLIDV